MNMVCDAVSDLIPLIYDKSAAVGTASFVRSHLEVCPKCRQHYKDYVKLAKSCVKAPSRLYVDTEGDFDALAKRLRKRRSTLCLASIFFLGGAAFAAVKIASAIGKRGTEES